MHRITVIALAALLAFPVWAQVQYGHKVVDRKPLGRENFVQGLEIIGNHLYLSSGLYGQSRLRRYDFDSGELLLERPLDPRLFAEGVTVLNGKVYQLTWRSGVGLIYKQPELSPHQLFRLPGEGWGITNDGSQLIYSDGSHLLHFLDAHLLLPHSALASIFLAFLTKKSTTNTNLHHLPRPTSQIQFNTTTFKKCNNNKQYLK